MTDQTAGIDPANPHLLALSAACGPVPAIMRKHAAAIGGEFQEAFLRFEPRRLLILERSVEQGFEWDMLATDEDGRLVTIGVFVENPSDPAGDGDVGTGIESHEDGRAVVAWCRDRYEISPETLLHLHPLA